MNAPEKIVVQCGRLGPRARVEGASDEIEAEEPFVEWDRG